MKKDNKILYLNLLGSLIITGVPLGIIVLLSLNESDNKNKFNRNWAIFNILISIVCLLLYLFVFN